MGVKLGRELVRTCCAGVAVHLIIVTACSAGGGGKAAQRGSGYEDTRLDGAQTSATDELPSGDGDTAQRADSGPALVVPIAEAKANEGGSRLQGRWYAGSDGSRQFLNWHDSDLGIDCTFGDVGDGSVRCLPSATVTTHYADGTCTMPIFSARTSPCGDTRPMVGAIASASAPGAAEACTANYRYYAAGAKTQPANIYTWTGSVCLENSVDPNQTYWLAGERLPITSFVSAEVVTE